MTTPVVESSFKLTRAYFKLAKEARSRVVPVVAIHLNLDRDGGWSHGADGDEDVDHRLGGGISDAGLLIIYLPAIGKHPDQPRGSSRSIQVVREMVTGFQEILDGRVDGQLLRRRGFFLELKDWPRAGNTVSFASWLLGFGIFSSVRVIVRFPERLSFRRRGSFSGGLHLIVMGVAVGILFRSAFMGDPAPGSGAPFNPDSGEDAIGRIMQVDDVRIHHVNDRSVDPGGDEVSGFQDFVDSGGRSRGKSLLFRSGFAFKSPDADSPHEMEDRRGYGPARIDPDWTFATPAPAAVPAPGKYVHECIEEQSRPLAEGHRRTCRKV